MNEPDIPRLNRRMAEFIEWPVVEGDAFYDLGYPDRPCVVQYSKTVLMLHRGTEWTPTEWSPATDETTAFEFVASAVEAAHRDISISKAHDCVYWCVVLDGTRQFRGVHTRLATALCLAVEKMMETKDET